MARKPITTLIWDLGLVMFFWDTRLDFIDCWRQVKRLGAFFASHDSAAVASALHALQRRLETGDLDVSDHRLALSELFGLESPLTWEEYRHAVLTAGDFTYNRPLHEAQVALAETPLRQGLISNLCPVMHEVVFKAGLVHHLDDQLYSFQAKELKPSETLLRRSLKNLHSSPEEALVIDDREDNCALAVHVGCHAHRYVGNAELLRCLINFGLPPSALVPLRAGGRHARLPIRWRAPRD